MPRRHAGNYGFQGERALGKRGLWDKGINNIMDWLP